MNRLICAVAVSIFITGIIHAQQPLRWGSEKELVGMLCQGPPAQRHMAYEALLFTLPSARSAITQALENKQLPPQARRRLTFLADFGELPATGSVYRNGKNPSPEGELQNGDIITKFDEDGTLSGWRKGKDIGVLAKVEIPQVLHLLKPWPDHHYFYTRYGHQGSWSGDVAAVLAGGAKPGAPRIAVYQKAWKEGCRDPLVAAAWLEELWNCWMMDEAAKVIAALPAQFHDKYPGGYGTFQLQKQILLCRMDSQPRQQVQTALSEQLKAASEADAWLGRAILLQLQSNMLLGGPPQQIREFWQTNIGDLLALPRQTEDALGAAVLCLAAGEGPFTAAKPFAPLGDMFAGRINIPVDYDRLEPGSAPPMYPMMAVADPLIHRCNAIEKPIDGFFLEFFGVPRRVEWEFRPEMFPAPGEPDASALCIRASQGRNAILLRLLRSGAMEILTTASGGRYNATIPLIRNRKEWLKVSIDLMPRRLQVNLNGQRVWTCPAADWPQQGQFQLVLQGSYCSGSARNLRFYRYIDRPVDNSALERLALAHEEAIRRGEVEQAEAALAKLDAMMRPFPAFDPVRQGYASDMELFRKIMGDGLSITGERTLESTHRLLTGKWKADGIWIVPQPDPRDKQHFALFKTPGPDDIEITGVIDAQDAGAGSYLYLSPQSTFADNNQALAFHPDAGSVILLPGKNRRLAKVDFSTPLPFCIRIKADQLAAFIRFGSKPDLILRRQVRSGRHVQIYTASPAGKPIRIGNLKIRALPKDTPIDAPVKMPTAEPDTPSSQPQRKVW
ncbi:MAG: hypothetical protein ABFD92_01800 [Planctomycetaceae bacterium]|nr:hypothetical protein [Planctomycetaceae bacterium]